ncbi:hypothetical protein HK096_008344, partial [Nowakowskiella sp. JEL0078]
MDNTALTDSWSSFWSGKLVPSDPNEAFVNNASFSLPKLQFASAPELLRTLEEKVLFYSRVSPPTSSTFSGTFFSSHILGSPSIVPLLQDVDTSDFALRIDYPHFSQISPKTTLNFSIVFYPLGSKYSPTVSDSVPKDFLFGVLICNGVSGSQNMDSSSSMDIDITNTLSQNSVPDIIKPEQILYELSQATTESPIATPSPEPEEQILNSKEKISIHGKRFAISTHGASDIENNHLYLPSIVNTLDRSRGQFDDYYGYINKHPRYFDPFTGALQAQGPVYGTNFPPFPPRFRSGPPPFRPGDPTYLSLFRGFYSGPPPTHLPPPSQQHQQQFTTDSNDEIVGALLLLSQPQQPSPKKELKTKQSKEFLCPQCSRSFTRRFNLQTHLETHQPNRV